MPLETSPTCDNRRVSNTFNEQKYSVVRRNQSSLILPLVVLALACAAYFFFAPKLTDSVQQQILVGVVALVVFFFWLLPSIRLLTNRYELTSNRVISRSGLFGTRVSEIAWGEVTGVSISRGFLAWLNRSGNINLHREFGADFVLKGVPRAKRLSREIETFLARRTGMGQ